MVTGVVDVDSYLAITWSEAAKYAGHEIRAKLAGV